MRSVRLTYPMAWHHVMSRGYEGREIFKCPRHYRLFLAILHKAARQYKILISAWCLMPNHYHLLLQNTSGRLSDFMKHVNSTWATKFRLLEGGKGYLFQGRFKSTLVAEDDYWATAFCYILLNPLRAGIVNDPWEYRYSSIHEYYGKEFTTEGLSRARDYFPEQTDLQEAIQNSRGRELEIYETRMGPVLGSRDFASSVNKMYEKRGVVSEDLRRRIKDKYPPLPELMKVFKRETGFDEDMVEFNSYADKRMRAKLLVFLRDYGGMKYQDIVRLPWFQRLKATSLGSIYANYKKSTRKSPNFPSFQAASP